MRRWNGRHPLPWDFFNTFNDASGKNLNWFWNNWFFSNNYIDLALKNVTASTTGLSMTVQNVGGMAAPFDVVITFTDGTTQRVHQSPNLWMSNQQQAIVRIPVKKQVKSVQLDGGIYVDATQENNVWDKDKKMAKSF
jgi:hypothetical protein